MLGKYLQLWHTGHCPIIIHYLADDGGGLKSRDPAHINAGFGLTGSDQNPAAFGS